MIDIFAAAGLKKPDISILSDQFLAEVQGMPRRNLAVELLQKLLKGEIRARAKRDVVQARSFAELLEQVVRKSQAAPHPQAGRHPRPHPQTAAILRLKVARPLLPSGP